MVRLWVLSDLHLETALFPDAYDPPRPAFDVLVAAGDIWDHDTKVYFTYAWSEHL